MALKGPVDHARSRSGFTSVNVGLRKALGSLCQPAPGVEHAGRADARLRGVDLVIVRENTEDLYAGLEHEVVPGVVRA